LLSALLNGMILRPARPVAGTPAEVALGRWAHEVVPGGS
jgi:hypothetical protein